MSKTAFMALLNREDSKLSPHFGKAKWVAVHEDGGAWRFVQNTVLNGRGVVDILTANGCQDVVFTEIGVGALDHLNQAGIGGWLGPSDLSLPELLQALGRGELRRAGHSSRNT
jgi:predicted Fe-Mo cluster-binding NifX family protein